MIDRVFDPIIDMNYNNVLTTEATASFALDIHRLERIPNTSS